MKARNMKIALITSLLCLSATAFSSGYYVSEFSGTYVTPVDVYFYTPDRLGSQVDGRTHTSSELSFTTGPSHRYLSFGPYHDGVDERADVFAIEAFIVFEKLEVKPHTYVTNNKSCRKRKWTGGCISWDDHYTTHTRDHGFTMDLTSGSGTRILREEVVRSPFIDNLSYKPEGLVTKRYERTPSLTYELKPGETLDNIEIRIKRPFGADFEMNIKYAVIKIHIR